MKYLQIKVDSSGTLDDVQVKKADNATNDSAGNNISSTYAKKSAGSGGFVGGTNANLYSSASGGAIGYGATVEEDGFAGGANAYANNGGAVGKGASAGNGFAGGQNAVCNAEGNSTVQLGEGTNTSDNTLQFRDYQVVDANGNIPAERLKSALLDLIFPVGSIYMNYANSQSPASTLGGSWTRIYNKFLIGAGSSYTIGSEGGEAAHALTANEMPAHTHTVPVTTSNTASGNSPNYPFLHHADSGVYTTESNSTGNNVPHNNMPPYRAVWMWRRTA